MNVATNAATASAASFAKANRAFGAIIFSGFGGLWLMGWSVFAYQGFAPLPLALIGLLTAGLIGFTYGRYKLLRQACGEEPASAEKASRDRWFNIINAGQWVVIFLVATMLNLLGWGIWIMPMIIFVVGVHFVLLAKVFGTVTHAVTGIVMMGFAVTYPFLATQGPTSPIGLLGAGLILWANALWAVRRSHGGDAPTSP
jgi:hypothetical protein